MLNPDNFIYHEMMVHPALFTHLAPEKVAILADETAGILAEALKHPKVQEIHCTEPPTHEVNDARVKYHTKKSETWLAECPSSSYDILIQTRVDEDFISVYRILRPEGIFVFPCSASLLDTMACIETIKKLKQAGFRAWQTLHFAQPSYPSGWRLFILAIKHDTVRWVKEKEVFNRTFTTQYYNYDMHKAALALPEFATQAFNLGEL